MNLSRRVIAGAAVLLGVAGGSLGWWWHDAPNYIEGHQDLFMAQFPAAPARESQQTRAELDELLEMQRTRTPADVAAAQADRRTDVSRFYGALGLDERDPPDLPKLRRLAERMEDDIRPYVRAAKRHYRRLRPYEIEPRLEPCIDDVQHDLSYPSGHATYGYAIGYTLADMVPERRRELEARAAAFARQRMVCGVHFPSDIRAGAAGAQWLNSALGKDASFVRDFQEAAREVRQALRLPGRTPAS